MIIFGIQGGGSYKIDLHNLFKDWRIMKYNFVWRHRIIWFGLFWRHRIIWFGLFISVYSFTAFCKNFKKYLSKNYLTNSQQFLFILSDSWVKTKEITSLFSLDNWKWYIFERKKGYLHYFYPEKGLNVIIVNLWINITCIYVLVRTQLFPLNFHDNSLFGKSLTYEQSLGKLLFYVNETWFKNVYVFQFFSCIMY